MPKSVDIDGVRFESSAAIAARFGISVAEVEAFTRGSGIESNLMGHILFIDPTAFDNAYTEKGGYQESSLQDTDMQHELLLPEKSSFDAVLHSPSVLAATQTVAVVACGLFVGVVGWYAQVGGLDTRQLQAGAYEIYGQFSTLFTTSEAVQLGAALPQAEMSKGMSDEVFTVLPKVSYEQTPTEPTEATPVFSGIPALVE